jgi:hypothetical protein
VAETQKALPGGVPEEPALKKHVWGDIGGQPSWLNNLSGNLAGTCKVCGCELLEDGAVIQADQKVTGGRVWIYRDALGREVRSFVELSCPVFVGLGSGSVALASAAVEAKEIGRKAKAEAQQAQARITQLERATLALGESMEARLVQLERENAALREQVGAVQQIDITQLARVLLELAQTAKEQHALESITSGDRVLQIPRELREVIDVVGIPVEDDAPPDGK